MASEATGAAELAGRYAIALFELADERKLLDRVAEDLRGLRALVTESADLKRLIRSPVLAREAQGKAIAAIAARAGLDPLTQNFLGLLARNRRLFALPAMIERFLTTLAERRGEVRAEVVAARELTPEQRDSLDQQLRKSVGQKVAVDIRIDPSLLGGLVVKFGSRMVDASLKSKLQRLEMALKGVR